MVYVYPESKAPAAPLAAHRAWFDNTAFVKCLEEKMASDAPGATAGVTKVPTPVNAPNGGVGVAYDVAITAGSVTLLLRVESYAWQNSNALASVNLFGPKNAVTAEVPTAAVTKLQAALEAAASVR